LQKVKVFLDSINTRNKKTHGSVEKVFLMDKIGSRLMGSLVYYLIKVWWKALSILT
jgi:hypothetical protein